MKIQLFVAATLVAGGYAFAAQAGAMDRGSNVDKVSTETGSAKPAAKGQAVKGKGIAQAKVAKGKAAPEKARKQAVKANGKRVTAAKAAVAKRSKTRRTAKRQRISIDTTTTASIADIKAIATGRDGILSAASASKAAGSVSAYSPIIARYAANYGVPVTLAHAVIKVESNYRPGALGRAGEIGLMQIKPATARMMGYSGSSSGLYDPDTNIRFGMKYLAMAHNLGGGTTCGTILKYNAGHAATRMNPISAAYCSKVQRHMAGL